MTHANCALEDSSIRFTAMAKAPIKFVGLFCPTEGTRLIAIKEARAVNRAGPKRGDIPKAIFPGRSMACLAP
jgi:hypothetical protein